MTLKKYAQDFSSFLLFLLFLHLLDPFGLAPFLGYTLVIFSAIYKKKQLFNSMDGDFLILVLFSVTYSLFNALGGDHKGFQYLIIQTIFPGFFYLFGKILINEKITKKQIILLLIILGISFSLTSIISVILDLLKGGFAQTNRSIKIFWTGSYVKATGLSGYLTYNLLILGIVISNGRIFNWLTKGILIGIYIISLLCIFRLGSRTGIVLTLLTLVFAIVIVLLKQSAVKNLKFLFQLFIIGFLVFKFVPFDLNAEYLSTLGHRLQDPYASSSSSAGGRTELWLNAIDNFIKYPFGWQARRFSHNVWLDVAKVGGIIPFILLVIFNFRNLYNLRTIFKYPKNNLEINISFTLFTIGPLIYFFVEPALEGSFFAFTFFVLFKEYSKVTL